MLLKELLSYYPFGINIKGLSANSTVGIRPNKYLYNGKMTQDEMGLGWLDYGAKYYDSVLGRWHSLDPLAELNYGFSLYTYVANTPTIFIDPDVSIIEVSASPGSTAFQQIEYSRKIIERTNPEIYNSLSELFFAKCIRKSSIMGFLNLMLIVF